MKVLCFRVSCVVLALVAAGCPPLMGDQGLSRIDPYRRINATVAQHQLTPSIDCSSGLLPVASWASYLQDGDDFGVFGRRLLRFGSPLGAEIPLSSTTVNVQHTVVVRQDDTGAFVALWQDVAVEGVDGGGVRCRRFSSGGVPLTAELAANSYTPGVQQAPSLAVRRSDGSFVAAWIGEGPGAVHGIYFRRFSSAGIAQGVETLVSTDTSLVQTAVAMDQNDGSFVVSWTGTDVSGRAPKARKYDALGNPLTAILAINTSTTGPQDTAGVAVAPDGSFVVIFSGEGQGDTVGVLGQRFSAGGAPLGGEFWANYAVPGDQRAVAVAYDETGGFLVLWIEDQGATNRAFLTRFDAAGDIAIAGDFPATATLAPANSQNWGALCADGPTSHRLVLSEYNPSTLSDIWTERIFFGLFADGFEFEDLSAWSSAAN